MTTFAVHYVYDDDSAGRDRVRPEHRAFLRGLLDEGTLVASGPWLDGAPGALLLVRATSAHEALALLDDDPFHLAGLVPQRQVRAWDPVLRSWD